MIVEFEHSNETRSCLGEAQTKEEAWKLINDFLAKCDYKAPYFRVNPIWEEHRIWIDAGSHTETIRRADVRWEAAQADSAGMPTGYVATVTFRGSVTLTHTTGYQVTARYQGTLTSTARQMTVTATYQAPVEDAGLGADAASGTALLEPEAEAAALAQGGVNLSAGAIAGTATAAVAAAFAAFVFFRTRNVRICTRVEEKTIAKAHARRAAKGLELTLPARISLKDGVILYLRQNLCDGGPLTVAQAGVTVFEGLAEQRIVLDPPASAVENSR